MPASQDGPAVSRRWQPPGLHGSPGSPCPSLAAPCLFGEEDGSGGGPGYFTVFTCTVSSSPRGSPERVGAAEHPAHPSLGTPVRGQTEAPGPRHWSGEAGTLPGRKHRAQLVDEISRLVCRVCVWISSCWLLYQG